VILICANIIGRAQSPADSIAFGGKFEFSAVDINMAGLSETIYSVANDSIIIKDGSHLVYEGKDYVTDSVYFRKALSQNEKESLAELGKMRFDSLKNFYNNPCIIDGLLVFFSFKGPGIKKDIMVSNYYKAEIASIIDFINQISPKKYHIRYNKEQLLKSQNGCKHLSQFRSQGRE